MRCSRSGLETASGQLGAGHCLGAHSLYLPLISFPEKVKLLYMPQSSREELPLGLAQGCVSIGVFLIMLFWAQIFSTKSRFLHVLKRM